MIQWQLGVKLQTATESLTSLSASKHEGETCKNSHCLYKLLSVTMPFRSHAMYYE